LIGVTTESLRNYQRFGIIESQDDRKSVYKCFDPISVGKLLAMRKLQTMGCRLADVSESMKEYSLRQYSQALRSNLQDAKSKLDYQRCLIERMQSHLSFAESVSDCEGAALDPAECRSKIRVDMSPAYYCFDYLIDDAIDVVDSRVDQFVQWTQYMLFVLNYSPCTLDGLTNGISPLKIGLAVEEKYVTLLGLDISPPVYLRPAKLSVMCPIRHLLNGKTLGDAAEEISKFMGDNGLSAVDGAYYVNEISYHRKSEEFFFSNLYIPVQ